MVNNNKNEVSIAASICTTSASDMPRSLANHLYENGAFMIFLDVPQTTEFGIDYKSWHVGPKFLGLKMIPPGVHFIFFSVKTAPRIGFFHHFKEKEILLRKWDSAREDMIIEPCSADEIERVRSNLKSMDDGLAPYPFETYRSWFSLSNYITEKTVERLRPENQYSRITGQAELITLETEMMEKEGVSVHGHPSSCVDRDHPRRIRFVDEDGLPIMKIRDGFQIRFTEIPLYAAAISSKAENSLDRSWQLHKILADLNGEWFEFLGELQFAFVCFLMGQVVYEGFEQWKRLIHLLCSCIKELIECKELYMALISVLHFQLKECPEDFFVDIVSRDNFLTTTLSRMFGNINDCESADAALKERAKKFKNSLTKRFKWNFDVQEE
uniref:Protein AAR2 homolog n=1 Tax=Onchocerca volvulus TaxID=6282 RepID=A0A8R1XSJ1_ONCVO